MARFVEVHETNGAKTQVYTINVDVIEFFHPCNKMMGMYDGFLDKKPGTKIYFCNNTNVTDIGDFLLVDEDYETVRRIICGDYVGQ